MALGTDVRRSSFTAFAPHLVCHESNPKPLLHRYIHKIVNISYFTEIIKKNTVEKIVNVRDVSWKSWQ